MINLNPVPPCVFLGYPQHKKGFKLLNLLSNTMFISRDVKFYEYLYPYQIFKPKHTPQTPLQINEHPSVLTLEEECDLLTYEPPEPNTQHQLHHATEPELDTHIPTIPDPDPFPSPLPQRRSTTEHKAPGWLTDYYTSNSAQLTAPLQIQPVADTYITNSFQCFLSQLDSHSEPTSFKQALTQASWVHAMNDELHALEINHTWEVTDLPPGKKAIGCKWLFKTKYNPDGSVERNKARLVVLGNRQKYGVDYAETFAPVAKMATIRSFFALASHKRWVVQQMDVKNAFLHGDLQESVYMSFPPEYQGMGHRLTVQAQGEVLQKSTPTKVCKLLKSLYGLKQAPRQRFAKLSTALKQYHFTQSKCDYSLFTKLDQGTFT